MLWNNLLLFAFLHLAEVLSSYDDLHHDHHDTSPKPVSNVPHPGTDNSTTTPASNGPNGDSQKAKGSHLGPNSSDTKPGSNGSHPGPNSSHTKPGSNGSYGGPDSSATKPGSNGSYGGPDSSDTKPGSNVTVCIVVGAVIGILVISVLGLVFWFWRKRKNNHLLVVLMSRYNVCKDEHYEAVFEKLQANNNKGFIEDFDSLQPVGVLQPRSMACHPANAEKNREDAAYPYDKSLVKLSSLENSNGYINASYVPGYTSQKEFIAAQHPLPGTIKDFLYMILEKRVTTIVMLSNSLENFKGRGEIYWPIEEAKTFGNMIVTVISKSVYNHWIIRDFMVTNVKSRQSHQVRQFHFFEWQENCDMDDRGQLIQFVHLVRQYRKENSSNCPTLVHCRTGIGRSGVFIALNCIIDQLESEGKVDVFGTVQKMHLHRSLLVQTQVQYMFLHGCTLDIVREHKPVITDNVYQNNNAQGFHEAV